MNTPNRNTPKPTPKADKLVAYEVMVEGTYWGKGPGGTPTANPYEVRMVVPANYNDGGRGATYVKKALLGKIDGVPFLRSYKNEAKEMPYADYRQLRTHNIVDWMEVRDSKRVTEVIKQKAANEMSADELKAAITKLGITYPNPARKQELVDILVKAKAEGRKTLEEEADDRPNFAPKGVDNLDANIDEVELGTMVDTSPKDPNNPNLPAETDRFVDTFVS